MRRISAVCLLLLLGLVWGMPTAKQAKSSAGSDLAPLRATQTFNFKSAMSAMKDHQNHRNVDVSAQGGDGGDGGGDITISWSTTATSLRGQNGQRATYVCPANGTFGSVWGSDLYTDDSSICTAGVHAGLITRADGGTVTIEIQPGASSYSATKRYGVESNSYGSWTGSFIFVGGSVGGGIGRGGTTTISWNTTATSLRGQNGQRTTYTCPGNGAFGSVWGTDLYTDDSSICTAAVHAGLITRADGGVVTIEIQPGASSYSGTTRYRVPSGNYGAWDGSYVFVGGQPSSRSSSTEVSATTITWDTTATSLRGQDGQRATYICPANGKFGSVWGTDLYTDDSSICTAAVHAGLISAARGGTVTIEIRPGANYYSGTTRSGVTSNNYGSWHGSFIFN